MIIGAAEYLEDHFKELLLDEELKEHFHHHMFHGSDFDSSMLRIGAMNMTLHGIDNPMIVDRDSFSEDHAASKEFSTSPAIEPGFLTTLKCCS